jgi:hypothetical protein
LIYNISGIFKNNTMDLNWVGTCYILCQCAFAMNDLWKLLLRIAPFIRPEASFMSSHNWSLSKVRLIHITSSYPLTLRWVLKLFSNVSWCYRILSWNVIFIARLFRAFYLSCDHILFNLLFLLTSGKSWMLRSSSFYDYLRVWLTITSVSCWVRRFEDLRASMENFKGFLPLTELVCPVRSLITTPPTITRLPALIRAKVKLAHY